MVEKALCMAFILRSDTNAVFEEGSASGNVLLNDTDAVRVTQVRAGAGSYVAVTNEAAIVRGVYGTLTIRSDGSYVYAADYADRLKKGATASDTFTYDSTSGASAGSTTLRIALTGVNDAPVLTATTVSLPGLTGDQVNNGGRKVSAFLAATDADASALRGIAITGLQSGNGQWQFSTDGRNSWGAIGTVSDTGALLLRGADYIRFVPNGVNGTTADFTFRAWDQTSGATGTKADASAIGGETAFSVASGTAAIVVTGTSGGNQAPVGIASSASGTEDGPLITGQVRATDADGDTLTYALVAGSAVGGAVTIDPVTGAYSFGTAADFSGTASFRFTASDGSRTSTPATVTIAVAAVNDAPVAVADSARTATGTPVLLDVLANDRDADGNPLSITAVGSAANGTVQIQNGQVLYSPNAGFTGSDSFTYAIADGAGGTAQASAAITVEAAGAPSTTTSLTFRQGANGYAGAVDTMLKQNRPTTSYADAVVFRLTTDSAKNVDALLRFDGLFGTGPGQIPVGSHIVSAMLQIQVTSASTAGGTLNRMLVGWDASSTWNSLGAGVQTDGVEATSAGAAIGAIAVGARVFNVTDSLAAWNAAGSTSAQQNAANLGWVFNPTTTDPWGFDSSQGAIQPVLTITYTQNGTVAASLPTVSISAVSPASEAAGKITFNVSLSQASTKDVTVTFSTDDHTAKAGSDYVATAYSLTFLAGQTTKSFDVALINDSVGERLESFTVQLDSATNATIGTAVATGRITDNDVTVPAMPALNPTVVAVHNLANGTKYDGSGSYGIGDPSALAYIPTLGTLFVGDSEHDESPYHGNTNLFGLGLDGSYLRNHLTPFTKEPTGLAYNSGNGYLYIADDDLGQVSWVSPADPSVRLGSFSVDRWGFYDTEDLKFDPLTGHLHILDEQLYEFTADGVFVNSVPYPSVLKDAEALAYDPRHDLFFVAGNTALIYVMDAQGNLMATIDLLSSLGTRPKIKGLELAPSSNPNDGDAMSLYVADYGSDQVNDGRLFEIDLGSDWF